ncbi:MAG: hypothetical protein IPN79_08840 [Saprospiraceae bacterium]|nr:hypothetical protein [Saprospiraceae bacterium]
MMCLLVLSCGEKTSSEKGKTTLHKYGIPVSLLLPVDVDIRKTSDGKISAVAIRNDSGYNMLVLMGETNFSTAQKAKFQQREQIVNNPAFIKIVEDYEDGFLFEWQGEDRIMYDFRHIKIVGNKEIVFQAGSTCECPEDAVMNMLASVKI